MISKLARDIQKARKLLKKAWYLGMVLGVVCHFVPTEYQAVCRAVINACTP